MTSIHQAYYNYLESVKHNREMEKLNAEANAINKFNAEANYQVNKYNAETKRKEQQTSQQYTAAQIRQISANIAAKAAELQMTNDMNNWKKSVDTFNQDLANQKQLLDNNKLEFEKEKFGQQQANWWKEYEQKQGSYNLAKKQYELAVEQFKADKNDRTWKNVLSTSKELRGIMTDMTNIQATHMKQAIELAKLAKGK